MSVAHKSVTLHFKASVSTQDRRQLPPPTVCQGRLVAAHWSLVQVSQHSLL